MKKLSKLLILLVGLSMGLVACNNSGGEETEAATEAETEAVTEAETEAETEEETEEETEASADGTVTITDVNGEVEVPVNPETVVALDNRTFETLEEWGIEVAAVPKAVMPVDSGYVQDDNVQDIGNHREPDLELIAAVDPDLVIIGQRFAGHEDAIRDLVPEATVINLNWDVSEEAENPGENLVNGLKQSTEALGQIFSKQDEADQLIADFEDALNQAQEAYNGEDTIMGIIVSGGEIGYSAPGAGRVWGPMFEIFGWNPALEVDESSSDHKGDDISVEAIAESNPDWLMVLDRDAATPSGQESSPAKDVVENSPALAETTAMQEGNLIYAPDDTYTNESIQIYIELFNNMAQSFN